MGMAQVLCSWMKTLGSVVDSHSANCFTFDVRRSFRSFGAKHGLSRDACETVLAHRLHRNAVDEAYMRHNFEREAEHALHSWQAHIRHLVEGENAESNIVPLVRE